MLLITYNNHLRRKAYKRQDKRCSLCKKIKRLLKSVLLCSDRNKSHWSEKRRIWIIDWNDYRWICRDCLEGITFKLRLGNEAKKTVDEQLLSGKSIYGWC